MNTVIELTEREIIDENADYVLGMYDMYKNDQEIVDMLKMKGLSDRIVEKVLHKVKIPAYEKRVKQAKLMIGAGAAVLVIFVLIPFLVIHFSNSGSTNQPEQGDILINGHSYYIRERRAGEGILINIIEFFARIGFYVIIFGASQLVLGTYSFFKYKKLLKII